MVEIGRCCLGDSNAKTCTSVHCRNSSISSGVRGGTHSARVEDLLFVETRLWWWIFDWFSRREKVRPRKRSAPISEFFFCNSKPTFMLLLNLFYHVKPSSHHCSSRVFYSYVWNILDIIQRPLKAGVKDAYFQRYRPWQPNREFWLDIPQCGNLANFLPLWCCVKSILADFRRSKIAILTILEALNIDFWKISNLKMS